MGADTSVVKTNTYKIQWQVKKSHLKNTEIWKAKEKGGGNQYGRKPRIPEAVPLAAMPRNSNSEEVRGHWTMDTYGR